MVLSVFCRAFIGVSSPAQSVATFNGPRDVDSVFAFGCWWLLSDLFMMVFDLLCLAFC